MAKTSSMMIGSICHKHPELNGLRRAVFTRAGTRTPCHCIGCIKESNAAWRIAHPQKVKEAITQWRIENVERAIYLRESWRKRNAELAKQQIKAATTRRAKRNKEQPHLDWQKNNRDRAAIAHKKGNYILDSLTWSHLKSRRQAGFSRWGRFALIGIVSVLMVLQPNSVAALPVVHQTEICVSSLLESVPIFDPTVDINSFGPVRNSGGLLRSKRGSYSLGHKEISIRSYNGFTFNKIWIGLPQISDEWKFSELAAYPTSNVVGWRLPRVISLNVECKKRWVLNVRNPARFHNANVGAQLPFGSIARLAPLQPAGKDERSSCDKQRPSKGSNWIKPEFVPPAFLWFIIAIGGLAGIFYALCVASDVYDKGRRGRAALIGAAAVSGYCFLIFILFFGWLL